MNIQPYDGDQTRELVNTEQLYDALLASEMELEQRYRGSMAWKRVRGREYLYRKRRADWRSLGPRSEATEELYATFLTGRDALKQKTRELQSRIERAAKVNRALGLGRVPFIAARLARRLAERKLLGEKLIIVGTPALYAYERMAGGRLQASLLATADIDLLLDARREINLVSDDEEREGLLGILRSLDRSFTPVGPRSFRAANAQGFMVDLVTPMPERPSLASSARISASSDDLRAAEIEGLAWLQNSPRVTQTVIDEKGFPVRLVVPDPRAFALHKLWLSRQPSRDRIKGHRDRLQAVAVAGLIADYLPHLRFDSGELTSFPAPVRALLPDLKSAAKTTDEPTSWR